MLINRLKNIAFFFTIGSILMLPVKSYSKAVIGIGSQEQFESIAFVIKRQLVCGENDARNESPYFCIGNKEWINDCDGRILLKR